MSSSRISWSSFHACCSSAVRVGGLSGSSRCITSPVGSLLIRVRLSRGNQANTLSAQCKDHREDRLSNPAHYDPTLLVIFVGEVRNFKPVAILEGLASD